jgi:curved DNA-binding protein CbpA
MISDFKILGINETDDISAIKKAYHSRIKQLHPDTTDDLSLINNHYLFVEVCKAYQRLVSKTYLKSKNEDRFVINDNFTNSKTIVEHKDPAYVYYRNGIKIFTKIHPSEWKEKEKSVIATEIGDDEESQREAQKKVMSLVNLFPKAYYYFSIVVNDYPESVWVSDSKDKMKLIEERMLRYKSIIESFSSWKDYKIKEKERYQNMMKTTKDKYEELHDKMRKEWENKS